MHVLLALTVLAYLVGSIPSGLLVARALGGPDPRQFGSGNLGTANVYRLLGRKAGALTLLGDAAKGALPVALAQLTLTSLGAWQEAGVALVAAAAVTGHVFPLYLGFKGGKAVATTFGVVAVLSPLGRAQPGGGLYPGPVPNPDILGQRPDLRLAAAGGRGAVFRFQGLFAAGRRPLGPRPGLSPGKPGTLL